MKSISCCILVSIVLSGCVTADKNRQSAEILASRESDGHRVVERFDERRSTETTIRFYSVDPDTTTFYNVLSNFIVDNVDSALVQLSSNYQLMIVEIENNIDKPVSIERENLKIEMHRHELYPIHPHEFPKNIQCINWKGTLKNVYNFSVGFATTAYVILSIASCVKEGKCEGLRYIDDAMKLSQSGETDTNKMFSDPVFTTNLHYSDVIDLDNARIPPKSTVTGLLLYRLPRYAITGKRISTAANCTVR